MSARAEYRQAAKLQGSARLSQPPCATILSGLPNQPDYNYQNGSKYPSPVDVKLGGNITWVEVTGARVLVRVTMRASVCVPLQSQ